MTGSVGASTLRTSKPITSVQAYKKDVERVDAITKLFQTRFEKGPPTEYAEAAIGMTSDAASQWTQIEQLTTSILTPSQTAPVGTMSFHAWVKVIPKWIEFGKKALHFKKGFETNFENRNKKEEFASVCKSGIYAAYQLCSSINLARNLYTKFSHGAAPSKAFSTVASLGTVFQSIYNTIGGISAAKSYMKLSKARSLIGRVKTLEEKLEGLKQLNRVSQDEIEKKLPFDKKERKTFLENYFNKVTREELAVQMRELRLPDDFNLEDTLSHFAIDLSSEPCRLFFSEKYGFDDEFIKDLTPKAFLGMLLFRSDLSIKKQEAFISSFTENTEQKAQIRKQIVAVLKTSDVANTRFGYVEDDLATKRLFQTLDAAMNRKQLKNIATTICCALTVVACLASIVSPGAIGVVVGLYILANAIDYVTSLRSFEMAVKDQPGEPVPSLKEANWKLKILMTLDVAASLLSVAFAVTALASGIATGPAVVMITATIIGIVIYNFFNLSTVNKTLRDRLIKHAERIDYHVNQRFANFIGMPITVPSEEEEPLIARQEQEKLIFTLDKIQRMNLEQKEALAEKLRIDTSRFILKPKGSRYVLTGEAREAFLKTYQGAWMYERLLNQELRAKFEGENRVALEQYRALKKERLSSTLQNVDVERHAI